MSFLIDAAIHNTQSIKIDDKCVLGIDCTVGNLLVLGLKILSESWTIVASIGLCKDANLIVIWFVGWKLLKPCLRKVPYCSSGILSCIRCVAWILRWECSRENEFGQILAWYIIGSKDGATIAQAREGNVD